MLTQGGMGLGSVALSWMLGGEGKLLAAPHHRPRAKSVIWVFLSGGYSQIETFDPKPALNKYGGMTYDETGYPNPTIRCCRFPRRRRVASERFPFPSGLPRE